MVMMRDTRINDIETALSSQDGPTQTVVELESFSADKLATAPHDDEVGRIRVKWKTANPDMAAEATSCTISQISTTRDELGVLVVFTSSLAIATQTASITPVVAQPEC